MWGRLDGAGWIVHALLDPHRLRTLQRLDDDPATYGQRLVSRLSVIAGAGQIRVDQEAKAAVNSAAQAFLAVMSRPAPDVQAGLAACQVSSETLAGEKHTKLFAYTLKQTALVTIAALEGAGIIPAAAEPGLKALKLELEFTPTGALIRAADFVHRL